jgi:hypothetical protein
MSLDDVKADLARLYRIRADVPGAQLREADVQSWSASLGIPRAELYDRIAIYLARGFNCSELSFEFCDAIVNDVHGVITFADEDRPDLFWKVYLAFDEASITTGTTENKIPWRYTHDLRSRRSYQLSPNCTRSAYTTPIRFSGVADDIPHQHLKAPLPRA